MAFKVVDKEINKKIDDFQVYVRDTFGINISKEKLIIIIMQMKQKPKVYKE
jgi:hypothetical protein